jgi:hypothetical protein
MQRLGSVQRGRVCGAALGCNRRQAVLARCVHAPVHGCIHTHWLLLWFLLRWGAAAPTIADVSRSFVVFMHIAHHTPHMPHRSVRMSAGLLLPTW